MVGNVKDNNKNKDKKTKEKKIKKSNKKLAKGIMNDFYINTI